MGSFRFMLIGAVLAAMIAHGGAFAQTAPDPTVVAAAKQAEPAEKKKEETWTRKKWNEARKKWAQQKEKWGDCTRQSRAQKLRGRKRWTFIAECMTK
jgi:hypothetical protein